MTVVAQCFVRHHFEDCVFYNPRNGGFLEVQAIADFLSPLESGRDFASCAQEIAAKHGIALETVQNDLIAFYSNLRSCGLVEIQGIVSVDFPQDAGRSDLAGDDLPLALKGDAGSPIAQFYRKHNLPSELHLDLTNACSERCVHCYVPHGQRDFIPYEIVQKVLREFRELQGLTVQLSGGECMLHPDFPKICRLCRELDLNFLVLSNLTLCDENTVSVLRETDPQYVNVSLYSMDEKEHDAITQVPGSWKKTMQAIDACQSAGVHVRLAAPLLKANRKAYPALRQFANERHVHLIPESDIVPKCDGDCSNLAYACTPEEMNEVFCSDKDFWNCVPNAKIGAEDRVCIIGERLFVNAKGWYYPCSGMNDQVLSDARTTTMQAVWNDDHMKYLRGLKNKDFGACNDCANRSFCKVCPAVNRVETGSYFTAPKHKCVLAQIKRKVYEKD